MEPACKFVCVEECGSHFIFCLGFSRLHMDAERRAYDDYHSWCYNELIWFHTHTPSHMHIHNIYDVRALTYLGMNANGAREWNHLHKHTYCAHPQTAKLLQKHKHKQCGLTYTFVQCFAWAQFSSISYCSLTFVEQNRVIIKCRFWKNK